MNAPHKSERGQVLILIVFGIIGLIGLTALSIDGGNAYLDRRRAQNAADTAAMAAGLARIRQPVNNSPADAWKTVGYDRAISNGFQQNGEGSTVDIFACTELGADCVLPAGAVPAEYIKVVITSVKNTWFGRIVGVNEVTNRVEAIAKAKKAVPEKLFKGQAIVALQKGCSPAEPMKIKGNFNLHVTGSGIFVNSSCASAYDQGGSSTVTSQGGVCVVGGASSTNTTPAPNHNCAQEDIEKYILPNPACESDGELTQVGKKEFTASPGNYYDTFPGDKGLVRLQKGIYCLHNGYDVNSQTAITTDWNDNGAHDPASEGVLFFIPDGGITFNGQATQWIHAISCHNCGVPDALVNLLFYLPPDNDSMIKINGGSATQYWGTMLAPSSHVQLNGGSGGKSLHMQIIALNFKDNGGGALDIHYDAAEQTVAAPNPELLLFK